MTDKKNENDKSKEFYENLKAQLEDYTDWPAPYLFKFIVPTDKRKIQQILSFFEDIPNAKAKTRTSTKGQYTSVSIEAVIESADVVIEKYEKVSVVEGLLSL
ncbi:MAG TPA: DUF493 family protein [Flavobacteriaceae bacterium]|nr:DUF493 family protein [Flavobacteriaceae bacterium]